MSEPAIIYDIGGISQFSVLTEKCGSITVDGTGLFEKTAGLRLVPAKTNDYLS